MKISSRGRYAVRVMAELASSGQAFVSLTELAAKQNLSVKYLERIAGLLVKAGLLTSAMGAQGGYRLAKAPTDCSVADILRVTDDLPALAPCLQGDHLCAQQSTCRTVNCWDRLSQVINDYLASVTLQDLIAAK